MKDLLLPDLEIIGFRGFDAFRIDRLGRVNLITGRNGVGKSSLLEALRIYATRGEPLEVLSILESRDEGLSPIYAASNGFDRALLLRSLFFGRPFLSTEPRACSIGPSNADKTLRLSIEQNGSRYSGDRFSPVVADISNNVEWSQLRYNIELGAHKRLAAIQQRTIEYHGEPDSASPLYPCLYFNATGLGKGELGRLWDIVALTDLEDDVLDALHIIKSDIARINMIGQSNMGGRIPIVKVAGFSEPVPLRSLGDGLNRLFGIALILANARNGLLLIDEIENGLHYSIQRQLWKLIFATAKRLNVQVFATTHSWDCIEAFQQAACENTGSDGLLVRLENKKGRIVSTVFDESDLTIATREQIEVR